VVKGSLLEAMAKNTASASGGADPSVVDGRTVETGRAGGANSFTGSQTDTRPLRADLAAGVSWIATGVVGAGEGADPDFGVLEEDLAGGGALAGAIRPPTRGSGRLIDLFPLRDTDQSSAADLVATEKRMGAGITDLFALEQTNSLGASRLRGETGLFEGAVACFAYGAGLEAQRAKSRPKGDADQGGGGTKVPFVALIVNTDVGSTRTKTAEATET
jgi:hypothetical protein